MCQETNLKTIELFLERAFCKARKVISGKGAKTKVRIMDDIIFVKMKTEYTGLERKMFKYISDNNNETNYYNSIREETNYYAQKVINAVCSVAVKSIDFRIDLENEYAFSIIVMEEDLENLIKNGTVGRPHQMPDDTPNL